MHYRMLAIAISIHTVIMFLLTYSMIAEWSHFHFNYNKIYMTLMMVTSMGVVMLVVMRSMYPSRRLNLLLGFGLAAVFLASFWMTRTQGAIGNEQFLRAMIPHHSSAILMCDEADITDPEIRRLCEQIVETQKREIAQMEAMLARRRAAR